MIGLFAFFYAFLHFSIYLGIDRFFEWDEIYKDIFERSYITVGFTAFLLLIPLAITSTKKMIRRLGKKWQSLHKLIYGIAVLGVVHFKTHSAEFERNEHEFLRVERGGDLVDDGHDLRRSSGERLVFEIDRVQNRLFAGVELSESGRSVLQIRIDRTGRIARTDAHLFVALARRIEKVSSCQKLFF